MRQPRPTPLASLLPSSGSTGSSPLQRSRDGFSALIAAAAVAAVGVVWSAGCSEQIIEQKKPLGGSCLACHEGITDVHPFFALACVDCHGGNDQVPLPAGAINIRDQALLKASHVLPLDPSMWWANGIDDDNDGLVDQPGEFFDGRAKQLTSDAFADARLATKSQMDSEANRDLNYLRFINPGDLRVADVSCGSRNRNANNAMVCHAEVVYDVRRSIMSVHSAVPTGALYGNAQVPRAVDYGPAFANSEAGRRFDARNQRLGRVGYTFDYSSMDSAWDPGFTDAQTNVFGGFNRALLAEAARANIDPDDDKFEAIAGPVFADGETGTDAKFSPGVGFTRTGQELRFFNANLDSEDGRNNRAVEVLQNINNTAGGGINGGRIWPDKQLHPGLQLRIAKIAGLQNRNDNITNFFNGNLLANPVDAALRVFRAYHSINFWATADNFGFVDFTTSPNADDPPPPDPANVELRNNNNPFGRGRPSGCTSCHVEYARDGRNREPVDRTVADNGRNPTTDLPFGIRADLGQRFYAERHEIKRTVKIETCGSCHGFVTRVDYALFAKYENETDFTNLDNVATIGTFEYQTPKGSTVRIFDNFAHWKNGRLLNDGEGVSEDLNNNGELDTALIEVDLNGDGILQPNEDLNKNGKFDSEPINEDKNGNGKLDIPDRVARSESFDGRQVRIVYGGGNGAVRLNDVHVERGMHCVDCHIQNDVHGDGNIYTRNWDAIQVECDDCHGTNDAPAALVFSGPNGGDDMTRAAYNTAFGKPWFERIDGKVFQRSRVDPNLGWFVPQVNAPKDDASAYSHRQPLESFDPVLDRGNDFCASFSTENACTNVECSWDGKECRGFDRKYAHIAERDEKGGLECYACHSSWQPNCLTCHLKIDVAKPKQEIWWGDKDTEDVFFQLFSYTRSPFILGHTGNVEGNKISPHRSTMQAFPSVVAGGLQIAESVAFSTKEGFSSMVSNPYFPHTVRTTETKQCVRCHTLTDAQGNIQNDHFITEATGQGSGRYANMGDWALVAAANGMQLVDIKKEAAGTVTFPGFDFSDVAPRIVRFAGKGADGNAGNIVLARDIIMHRGVSFESGSGDISDYAIVAHENGVSVVDIFGRDNPGLPPTELTRIDTLGAIRSIDLVDPAASQSTTFIALSDEELAVIDYRAAIDPRANSALIDPDAGTGRAGDGDFVFVDAGPGGFFNGSTIIGSLPHGLASPTRVRLHGVFAVVSHADGIAVFALGEADPAIRKSSIDLGPPLAELARFETRRPALDVVTSGRFAYVATGEGGVEIFDIGPVVYPLFERNGQPQAVNTRAIGRALVNERQGADSRGLAVWGSRLVVADGKNGVRILDVAVPAQPRLEDTIQNVPGGGIINNATAVQISTVPTRTYAMVANGNLLHAVNITPVTDFRHQLAAAANDPDGLRGLRLSQERWDPLTPFDPKNATRQIFTFPAAGGANITAISRGIPLDNIADKSGRKLRDAWSLGSRGLPDRIVARMRSVTVREVPGTKDIRGDGVGCIVREGDEGRAQRDPQNNDRCFGPVP